MASSESFAILNFFILRNKKSRNKLSEKFSETKSEFQVFCKHNMTSCCFFEKNNWNLPILKYSQIVNLLAYNIRANN